MDKYANGLAKATERMIYFCKAEMKKIKEDTAKPNTARQITNGGKLHAYNKMLSKLIANKKVIQTNRQDDENS